MTARHVLKGYIGYLNPKLHQSHDMESSDTEHQVTLIKADEGQYHSHRKTLEILEIHNLLLPLPPYGSAKPWGTREVPTLPPDGEERGGRGTCRGCPVLRHCLQERIRLHYRLTEGKFCPKASFIYLMGIDFNVMIHLLWLFVTKRRNKNDCGPLSSQLQRCGVLKD